MITLTKKLKKTQEECSGTVNQQKAVPKRISVRDRLLIKEVQEMESMLPSSCSVKFADPHKLHEFILTVCPEEGFWQGGKFLFHIYITEDYNMAPPTVKCQTKLWHPNISEDGDICLSLLRQNSIDGLGWAPTRRLKDVIWGLNSLFTDLLNFDDPLNISAAELYVKDKVEFSNKVRDYMLQYSRS